VPESHKVYAELVISYDIHQSNARELREAVEHLAAGRYRDAVASAHRSWEYFGDTTLYLLGVSDEDREGMRTAGVHGKDARRRYDDLTGDALGSHPLWAELQNHKQLRHDAEHEGKPVSKGQARRAIEVRLGLMRHVDQVLSRTKCVDQAALARASEGREAILRGTPFGTT
jgi:hypothetical protein